MIKKVTRKECPKLFVDISENIVEHVYENHRRGSSFYVESIVEFSEAKRKWYPDVPNYDEYIGFWHTGTYHRDTEHGTDWTDITELVRVEKREKIITVNEWVPM